MLIDDGRVFDAADVQGRDSLRAMGHRTAHTDRFVLDRLPPPEFMPVFLLDRPEYRYPERLNGAVELLDRAVDEGDGERLAVVNDAGAWTYARMRDLSDRIARVLVEEGLEPGGRVLLRGANTATLFAAWFAVLKAGGVAVTTMPMLRGREIATILKRGEVAHAIVDARCREDFEAGAAEAGTVRSTLVYHGDVGDGPLEARAATTQGGFVPVDTHRDDPALLAFTSGTTGAPKATVHYHRDLLIPADGFSARLLRPEADDRFVCSAPIAFTFGLGALVLFPIRARACAVTVEAPAPPALMEAIARHRATRLFTAPTAYKAMLPRLAEHDLSSLRGCVSAGEHLPAATWEAWREATGLRIVDGIGATELTHIFVSAPAEEARAGATGRAVPGYEACVLDDEDRPMREGVGRLAVRGPTGCRYLDDPRQATYVRHGWNVTGDTYRLDAEGWFWFVARSDDMIVSSGYNIAGPEVEGALHAHPAVAECAVVGWPCPERGHVVKAVVVPAPDAEPGPELARALQDHVKAVIAPYKYPRLVEFVAALPKTQTGKIKRFELRPS